MNFGYPASCPCCGDLLRGAFYCRRFLAAAGGAVAALALGPRLGRAETVPTIAYDSVPNPVQLPRDMYFGECSGVALNSKGHIFVLSRGDTSGPAYAAAATQLLEFAPAWVIKDGKIVDLDPRDEMLTFRQAAE